MTNDTPQAHPITETKPLAGADAVRSVALAAAATLEQFADLARATPAHAYAAPSERLKGGAVGKHLRHTIDHFRAAVVAAQSNQPIDYDHRTRETPIETSPDAAVDACLSLADAIRALDEDALAAPVRIEIMLSAAGDTAVLQSTLARELAFASHHAVHHAAMLKAIALEFGFQTPPTFGVAPSTLHYEQSR